MPRPKQRQDSPDDQAVERPDPHALIASQSIAGAVIAGAIAVFVICMLWTALTIATGRIFPWFTLPAGAVVGLAIRRYGRGFDYRFPLIAVLATCSGALLGNLVIALPETTRQLDAGVWAVVRGLTWRSFELFFDEAISVVDYIYAGAGSALAAFYSRRRLDRHEEFALRTLGRRSRGVKQ
jgi:hypothetical protein